MINNFTKFIDTRIVVYQLIEQDILKEIKWKEEEAKQKANNLTKRFQSLCIRYINKELTKCMETSISTIRRTVNQFGAKETELENNLIQNFKQDK